MIKALYSRRSLLSELGIIVLSILSTYLLASTRAVQQDLLGLILTGIIWLADVCIACVIIMTAEFQGGISVYYLLKVMIQLLSSDLTVAQTILTALSYYFAFKCGCVLLVKISKIKVVDYRNLDDRPQFTDNEQKRRRISCFLLLACLSLAANECLRGRDESDAPLLILGVNLACVAVELYMISGGQESFSRMISNALPYKLYFYVLQNVVAAGLIQGSYAKFIQSTLVYLCICFGFIRIYIGSYSSKFHKADAILFDVFYVFKGDEGHKYYRAGSNSDKMLKSLDRFSREMVVLIYLLSFFAAAYKGEYFTIIGAILLLNNYPFHHTRTFQPLAKIQLKYNLAIHFKLKIALPILTLVYLLSTRQLSKKQVLYDQINSCTTVNDAQLAWLTLLFLVIFLSQLLPLVIKHKLFRLCEVVCPLIMIPWVIWLECIHFKLVLLGLYIMIFCFEIIREARAMKVKGSKMD